MFPTPLGSDGEKGGPNQRGGAGDLRLSSAVHLLPTPQVADGTGGHKVRGGTRPSELLLHGVAAALHADALLPTPTSRDHKDTGDLSQMPINSIVPRVVQDLFPTPRAADGAGGGLPVEPHPHHGQPGNPGHPGPTTDTDHSADHEQWPRPELGDGSKVDWGIYGPAITRWEQRIGRAAPPPTELSRKGSPVLSAAFTEFLMGLPAGHVTDVPGISRADMLKCLGNGVVPLQAQLALDMLLPLLDEEP